MPLRITVELIPSGDESRKRKIAEVNVTNDQTGTDEVGNYIISASGDIPGGWDEFHHSRVTGIERGDLFHLAAVTTMHALRKE